MKNKYMKLVQMAKEQNFIAKFEFAKGYNEHNGVPELVIYGQEDNRPILRVNKDNTYQMLYFADLEFDKDDLASRNVVFTYEPKHHPQLSEIIREYFALNYLQYHYFEDGLAVSYPAKTTVDGTTLNYFKNVKVNRLVDFFIYHKNDIAKDNVKPEQLTIKKLKKA